jgi:mannosyltransferase
VVTVSSRKVALYAALSYGRLPLGPMPSPFRRPPEPRAALTRSWVVVLLPAAVALAWGLYRIGRPSLWRDEAVSLEMARRPLGDTFRTLGNIDLVHGLYYLLMHPVITVLGSSGTALRLPSALAGVAVAALTALLGLRLAGPWAGVIAGILTATAFPVLSRYTQEGRSYALVTAVALLATWLFVRALDRGGWRDFAFYGLSVALLGYLHLFALFLVTAHAVTVWTVRGDRARAGRWAAATGGALLAVLPLAVAAMGQSGQVGWLSRPAPADYWDFLVQVTGGRWAVVPVLAGLAAAVIMARSPAGEVGLVRLALPWLVVPPVLLLGISEVHPFYMFRYLLYCIPAMALLVAGGVVRLPVPVALVVALGLVLLAVPGQIDIRKPDARADDLRRLSAIIGARKRPGDAVVFRVPNRRVIVYAYPHGFAGLNDVALLRTPRQAANLWGSEVDPATFAERLKAVRRIWYISNTSTVASAYGGLSTAKQDLIQRSTAFRSAGHWRVKGSGIYLYVRQ